MNKILYILYKSSFDTDKPREHMAEPEILLVTTNKDIAIKELLKEHKECKEDSCYEYVDEYDSRWNWFDFNERDRNYGRVGILEYKMENEHEYITD